MALKLTTYSWGEKRKPGEGVRLSCTRYLPRGVRKEDRAKHGYMDAWLPLLAPSPALIKLIKRDPDSPKAWKTFVRRYRSEMAKTDPRQAIDALAQLARHTPIALGCSCAAPPCHRFELEKLIRAAAKAR